MSDPILGLTMLGLIVVAIMMGFPTAFTLMGLGMLFGFVAYYTPGQVWTDNLVFDLMVERTYGVMINDTLVSVPLFVLMGYVIERGALVDRMFYSIQLAFRKLPGSLAVTTLLVCTFWGIGSGIVGAVVVLMGVIAMRPMLDAGYDVRLASGAITAGGTLGILIPPSVMLIVYAAVAGESIVKLYAAAMLPGFFLAALYLVYIIGWSMLNPKIAPKLESDKFVVHVPTWMRTLEQGYGRYMLPALLKAVATPRRLLDDVRSAGESMRYSAIVGNLSAALIPLIVVAITFGTIWWYFMIHNAPPDVSSVAEPVAIEQLETLGGSVGSPSGEPGGEALESLGSDIAVEHSGAGVTPEGFTEGFFGALAGTLLVLAVYYRKFDAEQLVILKMLAASVLPLGILTFVVLAVILFGITTATESAAIGAAGAYLLAIASRQLTWKKTRESVYLTAKTTAMICWLFVGSSLFSGVFALHGGQQLIEAWVLNMDLSPIQFMLLAQAIIFFLGWPLEWTEIIVIFVPIFIPLLAHFDVNPILFGTLVAVNLQAAFLSPPVAMSAFYLKGVSPPHVTLNQIFAGMMPYMFIVIICMVFMYIWPGMTLWLPEFLYGN